MNWPLMHGLPRLAAFFSMLVWAFALVQFASLGFRLAGPGGLVVIVGVGLATLFGLFGQSPKQGGLGLALWLSGGIWSGSSYVNTDVIGAAYLIVALLTLGGAAVREHERGKFSVVGPIVFIAAMLIFILIYNLLSP